MLDEGRSVNGKCAQYLRLCWADRRYCSHAMLVDQKTEGVIVPLNEFLKSEGRLELANSKLVGRDDLYTTADCVVY